MRLIVFACASLLEPAQLLPLVLSLADHPRGAVVDQARVRTDDDEVRYPIPIALIRLSRNW